AHAKDSSEVQSSARTFSGESSLRGVLKSEAPRSISPRIPVTHGEGFLLVFFSPEGVQKRGGSGPCRPLNFARNVFHCAFLCPQGIQTRIDQDIAPLRCLAAMPQLEG